MDSSRQTVVLPREKDCTLVIMAKAPRPGRVKTRLTEGLPTEVVTAFYRCLLDDTIALAQSLGTVEVAIMCPASDVDDLASFAGESVSVVAQSGDGLAAGLTSVFEHFAAFGGQRVIAFNSDSPHLPAAMLERAFEALRSTTWLLGQRTTEAITSWAPEPAIPTYSTPMVWEGRMRWRRCWHESSRSDSQCNWQIRFTTSMWRPI